MKYMTRAQLTNHRAKRRMAELRGESFAKPVGVKRFQIPMPNWERTMNFGPDDQSCKRCGYHQCSCKPYDGVSLYHRVYETRVCNFCKCPFVATVSSLVGRCYTPRCDQVVRRMGL